MANDTHEKKKILLVDDDDIQLTAAEALLEDEYEIRKAKSGEDAIKYLCDNEFTPSLIMLDIMMPEMNGWEVFNRIRAIGFLKNVPIAFLTSLETEEKHAQEIGAVDYITKPYNVTSLKSRIKDILKD